MPDKPDRKAVLAEIMTLFECDHPVLYECSLARIMVRDHMRGHDWHASFDHAVVMHIADWIESEVAREAPWIANVDALGRPRKLMKFGSLSAMSAEADRAMGRLVDRAAADDAGGFQVVQELEGGYRVVMMTTPEALDFESAHMGHCIGGGAYDRALDNGTRDFFSLRDARGRPHVTMEVERQTGVIRQFQGKQNRVPVDAYVEVLRPFFRGRGYAMMDRTTGLRHVLDTFGELHRKDRLPEGIDIRGDLTVDADISTALPERLRVSGSVVFRNCGSIDPPRHLEVGDWLSSTRTTFIRWPETLVIGRIVLSDPTRGEFCTEPLPDYTHVSGSFNAEGSKIAALPRGFRVGSTATLRGSGVNSIPDDATFDGDLDISDTLIRRLPAGFTVGGKLVARGFKGDELPEGLTVGGDLDLSHSKLEKLPARLRIGGSLFLTESTIRKIPADAVIGGSIFAHRSALRSLPRGLTVDGNLDLSRTPILTLPEGLAVTGTLELKNTAITVIPEGTKAGCLTMQRCLIETLPASLRRMRQIDADWSKLRSLPDCFSVSGTASLAHTPLSELPRGFYAGSHVTLQGTAIRTFPDEMHVGGELRLEDLDIVEIAPTAVVRKSIFLNRAFTTLDRMRQAIERKADEARPAICP